MFPTQPTSPKKSKNIRSTQDFSMQLPSIKQSSPKVDKESISLDQDKFIPGLTSVYRSLEN